MADDKELVDTVTICTSEDAFEKFQAKSMYEEDEFITLSDIVPPQPAAPDLSNELIEIPYDNEVVLSSSQNDCSQYGVSESGSPARDNVPVMQFTVTSGPGKNADPDYANDNNLQAHDRELKTNKRGKSSKRGGKRKRQLDDIVNNDFSETLNNSGNVESQTTSMQESVHSTTTDKNDTEISNYGSDESHHPRRTRRERIPNTGKYPLMSEAQLSKSTPGKRRPGRPKKVSVENLSNLEPDSTNTENSLSSEHQNNTENSGVEYLSSAAKRGRKPKSQNNLEQNKLNEHITPDSETDVARKDVKKGKKGRKKKIKSNEPQSASVEDSNNSQSLHDSYQALNEKNKQLHESNIINENTDSEKKSNSGKMKKAEANSLPASEKLNDTVYQDNSIIDDDDDDADDMSLSNLKKEIVKENNSDIVVDKINTSDMDNDTKRDSKMHLSADFDHNIDKIEKEMTDKDLLNILEDKPSEQNLSNVSDNITIDANESLLVVDTSKRPIRRKVHQNFKYDEDSDEDPFANVELSDDDGEPKNRKKGRYYSDDEYIPGGKKGKVASSSTDTDIDEEDEILEGKSQKRKKTKLTDTPKKRSRKNTDKEIMSDTNVVSIDDDKDLEKSLNTTYITPEDEPLSMKPPAEAWATSNEFENFIAQKIQGTSVKIKKVTSKTKTQNSSIDIPVIDQMKPKEVKENSTQTHTNTNTTVAVQTCPPHDIPMKMKIDLTPKQSVNACEFLNSVVKTTSELGQLMKEKSEDFMKKKINTENVTDTFKMDYCVRKSFLLFKLAKHNLMQMEEDLAKQYDEFLKKHGLSLCRDELKCINATPKEESDSDCEIVEVKQEASSSKNKDKEKPKFNPKTVFLNKELSIKIAKKPTADKKLEIKGRHTVWINDSVMVKKVKPTQSFLAQDSRNKKPPDCVYVTEKMVSDFFEDFYRQKALAVCTPFVNTEWSNGLHREYACHYFVKCDFATADETMHSVPSLNTTENDVSMGNYNSSHIALTCNNPKSLASLCAGVIQHHMHVDKHSNGEATCDPKEDDLKKQPQTLFRLCYRNIFLGKRTEKIWFSSENENETIEQKNMSETVPSLKVLCYKYIASLLFTKTEMTTTAENEDCGSDSKNINNEFDEVYSDTLSENSDSYEDLCAFINNDIVLPEKNILDNANKNQLVCVPKSLAILCLDCIQTMLSDKNRSFNDPHSEILEIRLPRTLKSIAYDTIKYVMYPSKSHNYSDICSAISNEEPIHDDETAKGSEICIALKQEIFHTHLAYEFEDDEDYDNERDAGFDADQDDNEQEWASQVQMQELRSCVTPVENTIAREFLAETSAYNSAENVIPNNINDKYHEEAHEDVIQDTTSLSMQIKEEPQDEVLENQIDPSIVKAEPVHGFPGMTIIPESIVTKSEMRDYVTELNAQSNTEPITNTFDRDSFEQFARASKLIRGMDEYNDNDAIFSQSVSRVRREHEPDPDAGTDMNLDLLVPQTYEPLQLNNVKDSLMESSGSDEDKDNTKKSGKKKPEKKARGRPRKTKNSDKRTTKEISSVKEVSDPVKEKVQSSIELAALTRRMRDKIRQEEKRIQSSDSESENVPLSVRKDKNKNNDDKPTSNSKRTKNEENDIQCNNVDSTAQILEKDNIDKSNFTGFSAIEQNEITTYQKCMKFVYDRIMPKDRDKKKSPDDDVTHFDLNLSRSDSPIIDPNEPVELLECEPTMPNHEKTEKVTRSKKPGKDKENKKVSKTLTSNNKDTSIKKGLHKICELAYVEKNGWHCYDVNQNDPKLYEYCHIPLEKLPESFVDTYLEYHDITRRDKNDEEVERLTNLQTLNRSTSAKDARSKKLKERTPGTQSISRTVSRSQSPANSVCYDELTPSEDEGADINDEIPPPVPARTTENTMAKNSLMDDYNSDSDGSPKKPKDKEQIPAHTEGKRKPGPKSKTKVLPPSESLMLTADKMMNKELTLLHAPIVLKQEVTDTVKEPSPKEEGKTRKKSARVESLRSRIRTEDDSSSEEEKQWVTTKEKLLKRLGKKEDTSADDAKRAKLVTEYIERRVGAPGKGRRSTVSGGRRSRKKYLEQQKQLRVLSRELLGEPTGSTGRGAAGTLFKGRRNIRKVIDKKSLQRGTVLANMEEFERKRRLNSRQTMLKELHGCEEGVNVLVINDEVCLEYDFEQHRPTVTVHPFFTKVMKAHQYEGVKFMWDACFESLSCIEAGHAGGGCILAHCMGLGKTLQVLALLHTVLTHPRVGMQRVLVCCPLSTVLNWVDEIHKWIGPVTDQIKVFELSKLRKTYERAYQLEDWYNGGGIFIIGYELFRSLTTLDPLIDDVRTTIINKIRTALLDPGPDIIICDEGHLLKNDCSVLAVAMSRVVTKRRIILTGTPMQNNLREYYCMVNFVKPNLLGTYSEYSNRFENPIMNGQHRDSQLEDIKLMKARTHILHKVLEGCLQRQEASVLYPYLPKKHEYTVFIPLTKCQWDLYKHYVHNYTKKSKQSVLKDFHILQKIWSHPQVLHNFQIKAREDVKKKEVKAEKVEDDLALEDKEEIKPPATEVWWLQYVADGAMLNSLESSNKFIVVFRILRECIQLGDKVLIFSTSLFCLDALEYFLQQMNDWRLGQEYYRLDGSVPAEVRQKWCREFNAENNLKTKLFLISTRAGCLGLNMTAANRVIILDTSWNPAHDIQSIFRVYRFGQKKDCYIYRLVAMGTMEQKIYERSVTKQAVACRVVDEQQIDRHYNMAELTELYRFDEGGTLVAGGVAVGVSDVALLRVARDEPRAVHAVHEHDSLLRGSAEPNLPEHERAAAWMQFQQEHAHKQMQNDIDANKKIKKLKKIEERERKGAEERALKEVEQRQLSQVAQIKTEEGPIHDPSLLPNPGNLTVKKETRGRKKGGGKIVKCRIPIRSSSDQPGPSQEDNAGVPPMSEEEIVKEITQILIKYNFTKSKTGPKQISELVANVKQMVETGKPISLGPGSDELTASIASVMMRRRAPPARTLPDEPKPKPNTRRANLPVDTPQETKAVDPPQETKALEGRTRRRAAIAAEKSFEKQNDNSQDSVPCPSPDPVIHLDEEWLESDHDNVPSDHDNVPNQHANVLPLVKQYKGPKPGPKSKKRVVESMSILLSDDEAPDEPRVKTVANEPPKKHAPVEEETVTLPPSLLSNQNFIKIVAHTYLAGNKMLDEDAATLAAQYSTLKALKEVESTGRPIDSGPIYDIALQVLGKEVLKKLQKENPKSSSSAEIAVPSFMEKLQRGEAAPSASQAKPEPSTAQAKPKVGPKSRVSKPIVLKKETPTRLQTSGAVPVKLIKSAPESAPDECILPDDEIQCVTPAPAPPVLTPPVLTPRFQVISSNKPGLKPVALSSLRGSATPEPAADVKPTVSQGNIVKVQRPNNPAMESKFASKPTPNIAPKNFGTICLDSDEEEDTPAAAASRVRAPTLQPGPVPVALTGPGFEAVPVALAGPDGRSVPLALAAARSVQFSSNAALQVPYSSAPTLNDSFSRAVYLVAAPRAPGRVPQLTRVPPAQVPAAVRAMVRAPVHMLPDLAGGRVLLRPHRAAAPADREVHLIDDEEAPPPVAPPPAVPPPAAPPRAPAGMPSPTPAAPPRAPAEKPSPTPARSAPTGPAPARPAPPPSKPAARASAAPRAAAGRRDSSSSSSSSSRASSPDADPDPLSILKDVVHIQAPARTPTATAAAVTEAKKNAPMDVSLKDISRKLSNLLDSVRKRRGEPSGSDTSAGKSRLRTTDGDNKAGRKVKETVDLTETRTGAGKPKLAKDSSSAEGVVSSKVSKAAPKTDKKHSAATVVGTSKNIVLDGKSKTLTNLNLVDLTGQKSVQVTNVKTIQPKGKILDKIKTEGKRPAAPPTDSAKKKKTAMMTLKDFDIDDIDDIIELD